MRLPKLDNRLELIKQMIGEVKTVCDVGADHGRLALMLAKDSKRVIATDISQPSLDKTCRIAKLHQADIDCRLGDGLKVVEPGEIDAAVLAGMGQNTIINIITQSRKVVDECEFFILQSMNGEYDLRDFLSKENFLITDEKIALESGRIYCIIKAKPRGGAKLSEIEKFFGPRLIRNPGKTNVAAYFNSNIVVLKDIVRGMEKAGDIKSAKYEKIKSALDEVEAIM